MFNRILVPLDGTPSGERVVPWVRLLARGSGSAVHLLTVCRPVLEPITTRGRTIAHVDQLEDRARGHAHACLQALAARLQDDGIPATVEVRFGDPVETILAVARDSAVELIAMATRGTAGLRHLLSPSVTRAVLKRASIPVLVARIHDQRAA
jgi:nucleotide-binding universal stress UspA family protein